MARFTPRTTFCCFESSIKAGESKKAAQKATKTQRASRYAIARDDAWPAREQVGADAARTKTIPTLLVVMKYSGLRTLRNQDRATRRRFEFFPQPSSTPRRGFLAPAGALKLRGPLGLKGWALGRLRLKRLKTGPGRF